MSAESSGPGKVSGGSESTSPLAGRDSSELPLLNGNALEAGWSNEPGVWADGRKVGDYDEADVEGEALAPRLEHLYDDRFFDDPEHRDHALDGPGPGAPEWQWDEYLA